MWSTGRSFTLYERIRRQIPVLTFTGKQKQKCSSQPLRNTVESRYLEYSTSRTLVVSNKTIGPIIISLHKNDYSISRTLDVSSKFVGPLTVRDIESWLYIPIKRITTFFET